MHNSVKDKLKNLSADQIRKLIQSTNRSAGSGTDRKTPKMPRTEEEIYPLSKAQERIWFLSQLYENTPLYNIPLSVKLKAPDIDVEKLSSAVKALAEENEILRTTFHLCNERPLQKIHKDAVIKIDTIDISAEQGSNWQEQVGAIGQEHAAMHFDLARLPLFAVKLIKINKEEYVLLLTLHHIISDGWTNSLLSADINLRYKSPSVKQNKPYTYIDYVQWEQEWLRTQKYLDKLFFWKETLKELPEPARFPRHLSRKSNSYEGEKTVQEVPQSTVLRIDTFCKKENITPFQFHFLCFAMLAGIYTQQEDLIIGIPVANRGQHYFQNTYGLFINSLPLRVQLTSRESFIDCIRRLVPFINKCIHHQEVPFSEIVKLLNPERNIEDNALFNLHFAYQHFPVKNKEDNYSLLSIDHKISKFDINFWVEVSDNETNISLTYRNRIISPSTIERFLSHYFALITAVLDYPAQPVSELSIFPVSDLSLLKGEEAQPPVSSWMDLFSYACEDFPDNAAVVDATGIISYAELNKKAESLAFRFARAGAGKGDIVIIDTGRNNLFIVSVIACFKLGCAYLPVAEDIPDEKLNFIISDSKASLLFSDKSLPQIKCLHPGHLSSHAEYDKILPRMALTGQNTAYVIYTSGTTGTPKGVMIPHAALLNYTVSLNEKVNGSSVTSYAHVSSIQADLGNTSIFPALAYGKTLLFPPDQALSDPLLLKHFFAVHKADVLKIVPSHLEALLQGSKEILPGKILICGGESLSETLVETVRKLNPSLRIINHYGPTETTIGVLTHEVHKAHKLREIIPVGKPLHNVSVMIADQNLRPVPKGVKGEICIGGASLALGYLNNPELTAQKFRPSSTGDSSKYYKTGDIGYINENNEVVFSGRKDSQIRFNGFRLELGEIENILKNHEGIQSAFVYVKEGNDTSKTLHAAVRTSTTLSEHTIKSYLKRFLSGIFIPHISFVKEIPLTGNGKVDYSRLKELSVPAEDNALNEGPRDLTEIKILDIFKSIFPEKEIRLEDGFFDIGGHSLLAIQFISKINSAFKTHLNVSFLFKYNSTREIAGFIRKNLDSSDNRELLIPLNDNARPRKCIWIHPAGGNVMCYYPISVASSSFADTWAFTASDISAGKPETIEELAEKYFNLLRKKRFSADNIVLAGWSMGALIAQHMACLFEKAGHRPPLVLIDQPAVREEAAEVISYEDRLTAYLKKVHIFTNMDFRLNAISTPQIDYQGLLNEFIRVRLVPEEVTVNNFKQFLNILVAHNEMVSLFEPESYKGPVLLLKATEILAAGNTHDRDSTGDLSWGKYSPDLTMMKVPGNHITMMNSQNSKEISLRIQNWLSVVAK